MNFKTALSISILLHVSLGALALLKPLEKKTGETTYYVDLIQTGGPGGGSGGGSGGQQGTSGASLLYESSGRMRDLTVSQAPKSSLRYPDKEGRKKTEEPKLISVMRKDRMPVSPSPANTTTRTDGLTMGISAGSGGSGTGSGGTGGSGTGGTGTGGIGAFFPYAYYVDTLKSKISTSWYSSLVSPGLKGKYMTSVYFKIQRNGEITDLKVERGSSIDSLDLSALRAVSNAAPFPPLPNDFPYTSLIVHFEFEWEK